MTRKWLRSLITSSLFWCFAFSSITANYQQVRQIDFNFTQDYGTRSIFVPLGLDDQFQFDRRDFNSDAATLSFYPLTRDQVLDALIHRQYMLEWYFDFDQSTPNYQTTIGQLADYNYVLPSSAVSGNAWWIRAQDNGREQYALVTKPTFGAVVKNGQENLTLWVQDLATGQANLSGRVQIYNLQEKINLLYQTDFVNGEIITLPDFTNADVIVVTTETDAWTIIPLQINGVYLPRDDGPYNYGDNHPFDPTARGSDLIYHANNYHYAFTDKPLYQRGQTVYFKAFLRRDDDARLSVVTDPITVSIKDPNDYKKVLWSETYTPDEFGGIDGHFKIPDHYEYGYYSINFGNQASAYFQISEYVKPEYELTSEWIYDNNDKKFASDYGREIIITGDQLQAAITGHSLAGHAMNGASFEYCFEKGWLYGWDQNEPDCQQWQWAMFDDEGKATLEIPTNLPKQKEDYDHYPTDYEDYHLIVRYGDGVSEPTISHQNISIHYTPFIVQLATNDNETWYFQANDTIALSGQIISRRPSVDVANRRVTLTAQRYEYPQSNQKKLIEEMIFDTRTDSSGEFKFNFTPTACDSYSLTFRVYDEHGLFSESSSSRWCDQENNDWYQYARNPFTTDTDSSLQLDLNKKHRYVPGETITIGYNVGKNLIGRRFWANFGRQRLDRYQVGTFTNAKNEVTYTITDTDQPNTYHEVSTFDRNNYLSRTAEINMESDLKKIKVEITTDRAIYNPGDTVKVTVKTHNQKTGAPVRSSVTLWTIDKALLQLASNNRREIFDYFWFARYHGLRTYHSLQTISTYGAEGGGGGGDDLREIFKDTAFWQPKLLTDANGQAHAEFTLPDNLTTWVLTGVAVGPETVVGESTYEFVVQKDVVARLIAPERLRVGDVSRLGFMITNYTDYTQSLTPVWEAGEGLQTGDTFPSVITLNPGETQTFTVPVKAIAPMNETRITTGVRNISANGPGDVLTKTISILPFGYQQKTSQFSMHAGEYNIGLHTDSDLSRSTLVVSIAGDIFASLKTAMNELLDYPRGCVEQTASRLLPALMAREQKLFADTKLVNDPNELISAGIKNLTKLQNSNGGWGFWEPNGQADPFKTTYVLKILLQANSDATPVDQQVLQKAAEYLTGVLTGDIKDEDNQELNRDDANIVASVYGLLLYLNATPVQTTNAITNRLTPQVAANTYYSRLNSLQLNDVDLLSWAVQANLLKGDQISAKRHLEQMLQALDQNQLVDSSENLNRYRSADADMALALQALVAYQKTYGGYDNLLEKYVTQLLGYRQNAGWRNTYATAAAIEALASWADLQPTLNHNSGASYALRLGSQTLGSVDFSSSTREKTFHIPLDGVHPGDVLTLIRTDGSEDTPVYVTIATDQWRTGINDPLTSDKLKIHKAFVRSNSYRGQPLTPGEIVTVYLGIENYGRTQYFVNIDDYLPSKLRPLSRNNDTWAHRNFTFTGFNGALYQLPPGMTIVSYQAMLTNVADQVSNQPTLVASMYDSDFVAQTALTDQVTFLDKQPAWILKGNTDYADTVIEKPHSTINWGVIVALLVVSGVGAGWWYYRHHSSRHQQPPLSSTDNNQDTPQRVDLW